MGENTKIEWADNTFNPWIGCSKVSLACDNCYAEDMMDARYGRVKWGPGQPRSRTSGANWRKPIQWDRAAAKSGERTFVFCASLADVFDNEVPLEWRADLFELIEKTPNLVWLLLTKRIGNVIKMVDLMGWPQNAAIGATMANQEEYNRDAPKLLEVKRLARPAFTFGSFEPLLGPVQLDANTAPDWVIAGGESGKSARPMDLDWARDLKADSEAIGRVFNFKQVGGRGHDKGGHKLDSETHFARPSVPSHNPMKEIE